MKTKSYLLLIGENELERIGGEKIAIYPGSQLHYGYSDSPDPIWVESVDEKWVTFYRYPYGDGKLQREQLHLFRNIAQKGTAKKLANLTRYAEQCTVGEFGYSVPAWCTRLMEHYRNVLAGEHGDSWDRDDIRMVTIEFAYTGEGDGWREFERTYPHSIGGSCERGGRKIYDSSDFSKTEASELCHKMNCGQLPGFVFIGMKHRD